MNTTDRIYPWKHLFWVYVGYAAAIFLLGLLFELTWGVSFYYAYGILIPALLVVGAWAGLGPGFDCERFAFKGCSSCWNPIGNASQLEERGKQSRGFQFQYDEIPTRRVSECMGAPREPELCIK